MVTKAKKARPRKGHSRLTRELLETAQDMHASGLMTKAARDKITLINHDGALRLYNLLADRMFPTCVGSRNKSCAATIIPRR